MENRHLFIEVSTRLDTTPRDIFYTTWLATSIDVITISFDCIAHFIALAWTFADVYILAMQRPGVMLLKNQLIKHSS
jgi:hypothetical protein